MNEYPGRNGFSGDHGGKETGKGGGSEKVEIPIDLPRVVVTVSDS